MSKFTWSYSSLSLFQQCPRKYYRLKVVKDVKDKETEALLYGKKVHKAAEEYVRDGKPIPPQFSYIQKFLDPLKEIPGTKLCEYEMGLTEKLEPCGFKAPEVWWRGIADLLIINGDKARLVDYKTGKSSQYADVKQLELLSFAVFKHFPEVQSIKAGLIFMVAEDLVRAEYALSQQHDIWAKWLPELSRLEKSYEVDVWNAKPNFSCKKFCPVTDCEHNGKGEWR
jgi:PD-(D/E)XK nuclease superfamily